MISEQEVAYGSNALRVPCFRGNACPSCSVLVGQSYQNRTIDSKSIIKVYRNLHRHDGVWYSIRQGSYVVAHTKAIMLADVQFVVQASGHTRALYEERRNVHAWLLGRVACSALGTNAWGKLAPARYDLATGQFQGLWTTPPCQLRGASIALLNQDGLSVAYSH